MKNMIKVFDEDMDTKCKKGMTAVNRFFKKYPQYEAEWRETFEYMANEHVNHIDDCTFGDGTVNGEWRYSLWLESNIEGFWYVSLILRDEIPEQETNYLENDVQATKQAVCSTNFKYDIIEFGEIESKRLKLKERAGFALHYDYFNINRYTVGGEKSCGYIFDGKARDYEKEGARIIEFNRNTSFTDIRNMQYGYTLILYDFYLGVSIHFTPHRKGVTHIVVMNPNGTQLCTHIFKNIIECKKWYYHLESVWSIEHGYTKIDKKFDCDNCLLMASCNKYIDIFTCTRDINRIYGNMNTPLKISIECKEYKPHTAAHD